MTTLRGQFAVDALERELGTRVRRARRAAGLTQQQLADLANVSVGTIKNLESGAGSTVATLMRVARALGREEWIEAFFVEKSTFNPLDLLPSASRKH
jgi:transcriptional regulator with XRE-family HTH domain